MSWDKLCKPKVDGGMGFKQQKPFNLAILAKQCWRLQMGQNSLVYHVFKEKYFPNCDFVEASLGNNPSYVWQSLMVAQKFVQNGLRWQIVNGFNVQVWKDKWLPSSSTYRVISPRLNSPADLQVSKLIDLDNKCWNLHLSKQLFLLFEVEEIRSIPLSTSLSLDKLIWTIMVCLLFRVSINLLWNALEIMLVHLLRMTVTCVVFGRNCGSYQLLIK